MVNLTESELRAIAGLDLDAEETRQLGIWETMFKSSMDRTLSATEIAIWSAGFRMGRGGVSTERR